MPVQCHLDQTFPLKSVMYVDDTKQICMELLLILSTLIYFKLLLFYHVFYLLDFPILNIHFKTDSQDCFTFKTFGSRAPN